jgi:peptidoglycan L-alanyl-D-glutamate endopeptidase CwlK
MLQRIFNRVIVFYDCIVLEGHRGKAAQNRAADAGNSKLRWPNGMHNRYPSIAVDVAPYDVTKRGVNWADDKVDDAKDLARFYHFAGVVKGVAEMLAIPIRWGGDWDGDTYFTDQKFNDLVHFELTGPVVNTVSAPEG